MVDVDWDLALGDQSLSEDELLQLAESKQPCSNKRGMGSYR